jgi:hypothetical protein
MLYCGHQSRNEQYCIVAGEELSIKSNESPGQFSKSSSSKQQAKQQSQLQQQLQT